MTSWSFCYIMHMVGLEPTRPYGQQYLKLPCLPISPHMQSELKLAIKIEKTKLILI